MSFKCVCYFTVKIQICQPIREPNFCFPIYGSNLTNSRGWSKNQTQIRLVVVLWSVKTTSRPRLMYENICDAFKSDPHAIEDVTCLKNPVTVLREVMIFSHQNTWYAINNHLIRRKLNTENYVLTPVRDLFTAQNCRGLLRRARPVKFTHSVVVGNVIFAFFSLVGICRRGYSSLKYHIGKFF